MCDGHSVEDQARYLAAAALSRRQFAVLTGAAGLAMLLPAPANAAEIAGRNVTVATPDGEADAYFVAPKSGRHPGVLMWPDIMGLRPAFRQMADRLAQSGYAVLVVNQFYRSTRAPFLAPGESFEYTSGTPLDTPSGFMTGAYHMVVPSSGENFDVAIPAFSLDSPHQSGRVH